MPSEIIVSFSRFPAFVWACVPQAPSIHGLMRGTIVGRLAETTSSTLAVDDFRTSTVDVFVLALIAAVVSQTWASNPCGKGRSDPRPWLFDS